MNKKLSLMMAALIAAGYSVTAEAGIYKVTAAGEVVSGQKYVVAVDKDNALSAEGAALSTKAFDPASNDFLWIVDGATTFKLKSVSNTGKFVTQDATTAALGENGTPAAAVFTEATRTSELKTGDATNTDFVLSSSPAFSTTGADAFLHIATTPLHAKTADGSYVYVTIDGKYAVNTSGTTVIYLDGTTVAMLGLQDKAKFTVTEDGVIMSATQTSNGITDIDNDAITLAVASIPAIEVDANNSTNVQVYKTVISTGVSSKVTDASTFALTSTAPSVVPQVPDGALAWTNGTTGVLYVTPSGDATAMNAVKADGTAAEATGVSNAALTIKLNNDGSYSLFNGVEQIKLATAVSFNIEKIAGTNGFTAKDADGKVLAITGTTLSWEATDGSLTSAKSVAVLSFSKGTLQAISAADLAKIENGGITLTASYDNGKTDIKGNPFTGFLTVVDLGGNNFNLKSGKKFIIGRKDMIEGAGTVAWGFTTVDKLSDMKDGDLAVFTAQTYAGEVNPSEVVLTLTGTGTAGTVGYYKVPDAVYMGAGANPKTVTFSLGTGTLAKWQDVLQKGKFFTVEKIKDYSTDNAKAEGYLVATGKTNTAYGYNKTVRNVLEGEWALTLNDAKDKYVLTNRETPEVTFEFVGVNSLYTTTSEYTYVSGADKYIITPVANHAATDGYKTLDQLEMQRFNIGSYAGVYDNTAWFTENHGEDKDAEYHVIGLNIDQEEGLIYEAIAHDQKRDKDHAVTDSIYVVSTIGYYNAAINNYDEVLDTLKVVSYTFKNQYNEPLYVKAADADFSKITYVSSAKDETKATKFTLRLDTDNTLNLRPVDLDETTGYNTFDTSKDFNKAYAGSSLNKGLVSSTDLYEREENDRFVVAPLAYEMYRRLENAVQGTSLDTISIFREGNNKEVLFENGQFLGMNNQVQFPAIAPAMVVDSAYAPADTYRPQYMLMVEPNYVPAGKWCPEHGFNPGCSHEQDIEGYTEGRYLVNLKDTAIAWEDANKHGGINPYTNTEGYVKLAFVPAKHIKDTLIINSDNNKLTVNTAAFNEAKFAFRYVDATAKSFVIETADFNLTGKDAGKIKTTPGYLKWMNGVIVVVDNIKNADVYNMTEDYEGNPTANEGINASSVSVIAGNGVVTINGAVGKKVVISNVLGQTIANAVLSSDNATISAPAGVVVVAVEGEAAVKAIVK